MGRRADGQELLGAAGHTHTGVVQAGHAAYLCGDQVGRGQIGMREWLGGC